jgi:hypothetical protein
MNNNTDEKLFRISADHLISQGKKSIRIDSRNKERCAYRGVDGTKCAIGVLIDDEHYEPYMEYISVESEGENGLAIRDAIGDTHDDFDFNISMLVRLQRIHDTKDVSDWPNALIDLANKYRINWTPAKSN